MISSELLFGLAAVLIIYAYLKVKEVYSYFEKIGVPYVKPYFPVGSSPETALFRVHFFSGWTKMCRKLEGHKIGGFFNYMSPYFIIRDPEYVQIVCVSSFNHFHDRGIESDLETHPIEGNLFMLNGQTWRFLRTKLTPLFSTSKLRWMYDEVNKYSLKMVRLLDGLAEKRDVDVKEAINRYTLDVISSTAFGMDAKVMEDPESEFKKTVQNIFSPTWTEGGRILFRIILPKLSIKLGVGFLRDSTKDYYVSLISDALDRRKNSGLIRKDLLHLLQQLKEKGRVELDAEDKEENADISSNVKLEFTDMLLISQSVIFLVGGYETTASCLYFTTYLLSTHPEAQKKAREEAKAVKKKFGAFTFDAIKELVYIENCLNETLRLYPPFQNLFRICTKTFTFPDGTRIEKGANVTVPVYALHTDPKYFPDPLAYKPERFEEPIVRGSYLPFGEGPRICIAKRFALMEMKSILATILDSYYIEESPKTELPIEFHPLTVTINPKKGLYITLKKID